MNRKIIFFEDHFIEFYQEQNEKVKGKVQYVFELIKQVERVPQKFLKHIEGVNWLYEIRVKSESNIFRIFCCFDNGDLVVLFNAFQKKAQKTPKIEIQKATRLMENYYKEKSQDNEEL